eukprot:CFRG2003T1
MNSPLSRSHKRGRAESTSSEEPSSSSESDSESKTSSSRSRSHRHYKKHKPLSTSTSKSRRKLKSESRSDKKRKSDRKKAKRCGEEKLKSKGSSDKGKTVNKSIVSVVSQKEPQALSKLKDNRFAAKYLASMKQKDEAVPAEKRRKSSTPMTKEMYEKQASRLSKAFDPDTGRVRLIRGDGEIVEEIVSRSEQKRINEAATFGDGYVYQKSVFKDL